MAAQHPRNITIVAGIASAETAEDITTEVADALTSIVEDIIDPKPQGGALNYDLKRIQDILFAEFGS